MSNKLDNHQYIIIDSLLSQSNGDTLFCHSEMIALSLLKKIILEGFQVHCTIDCEAIPLDGQGYEALLGWGRGRGKSDGQGEYVGYEGDGNSFGISSGDGFTFPALIEEKYGWMKVGNPEYTIYKYGGEKPLDYSNPNLFLKIYYLS